MSTVAENVIRACQPAWVLSEKREELLFFRTHTLSESCNAALIDMNNIQISNLLKCKCAEWRQFGTKTRYTRAEWSRGTFEKQVQNNNNDDNANGWETCRTNESVTFI